MAQGTLRVFGSIYSPSEAAVVYAQIFDEVGEPANEATVKLTLFEPDGTKVHDNVTMTHITDSSGLYKYEFTAPSIIKRMVADVESTDPTAYGSEDIYVPEFTEDVNTIKELVDELETGEKPPRKRTFSL